MRFATAASKWRTSVAIVAVIIVGGAVAAWAVRDIDSIDESARATERAERDSEPLPPTSSGPLSAPAPTIENVSLRWDLESGADPDGDARVDIRFRRHGDDDWSTGFPLRRVRAGSNEGFSWGERFTGSVIDLEPSTTYVVEARLLDPDGGDETRRISVTTRPRPGPVGAATTTVTPTTLGAALADAAPGDVIRLGGGDYGGFDVERSGTVGRPITVVGSPGATVRGEIGVFGQSHVRLEGLTIVGRIRFNGSDDVTIIGNTIDATVDLDGHGIVTFLRSEDAYIADNTINGVTAWNEPALGASGDNLGEGIAVTGPGHVIEHNRVSGVRDGISLLEESGAVDQFSIDIVDNDVSEAADDGIEADFCEHDCRVMRNRLTNTFVAMSSQPSLGGPTYFIRNEAYNVAHVAFKLYRGSVGNALLHNTIVKGGDAFGVYAGREVRDLVTRNNLFIGGPGRTVNGFSSGDGRAVWIADLVVDTADSDHDGFGSTNGPVRGRWGPATFDDIASLRTVASMPNARLVSLDVFADDVPLPVDPLVASPPVDLSVGPGSSADGSGTAVPNLGGPTVGSGPELGAREIGASREPPGPRSG